MPWAWSHDETPANWGTARHATGTTAMTIAKGNGTAGRRSDGRLDARPGPRQSQDAPEGISERPAPKGQKRRQTHPESDPANWRGIVAVNRPKPPDGSGHG